MTAIKPLVVSTGFAALLGAVAAGIVPTTMKPPERPEWRERLEAMQFAGASDPGQQGYVFAESRPIDLSPDLPAPGEPRLFAYYDALEPTSAPLRQVAADRAGPALEFEEANLEAAVEDRWSDRESEAISAVTSPQRAEPSGEPLIAAVVLKPSRLRAAREAEGTAPIPSAPEADTAVAASLRLDAALPTRMTHLGFGGF